VLHNWSLDCQWRWNYMNKVFILRQQIVTIHGQTHQVNGHFPHVRCATCRRNSQCKSTEEHSKRWCYICNVNVKFKMTVHEQVRYRGTLQCYNGLPKEEMSHSLFLHQFQITLLLLLLLLLHPFNGLFSSTTWVSWYQKGKTSLDLNEARDDGVLGWQWHQLDHMQTIRTSLQTDNHTNTSSLNWQAGCSSWRPTNSVKVLKA